MLPFWSFFGLLACLATWENFLLGVAALEEDVCPEMKRDTEKCKAFNTVQELGCIARELTMKTLVDCVEIKHQKDEKFCRATLPYYEDDYFPEDDWEEAVNEIVNETKFCVSPREVLIAGTRPKKCPKCVLGGVLQSCPAWDPNYHACLCHHRLTKGHFKPCLKCFKTTNLKKDLAAIDCKNLVPRQQLPFHEDELEPSVLKSRDEVIDYIHLPHASYDIAIDQYYNGWAYLKEFSMFLESRLPYWDESVPRDRFKRCYVSPWFPQAHCRTFAVSNWWSEEHRSAATGKPADATYSTVRTHASTATSTPSAVTLPPTAAFANSLIDEPTTSLSSSSASSPTRSSAGARCVLGPNLLLVSAFCWTFASFGALY